MLVTGFLHWTPELLTTTVRTLHTIVSYLLQALEQIFDGVQTNTMMSTSVVFECQAESEVWIQSYSDSCFVYGDITFKYSSFGGFLLQPL